MKKYEQILSKISPVFYKLVQYHNEEKNNVFFIEEYFVEFAILLPNNDTIPKPLLKDFFYHYYTGFFVLQKHINELTGELEVLNIPLISLFTKNSLKNKNKLSYDFWYVDEFIVTIVINAFSFENGNSPSETLSNKTFKDLFIAAVGKGLYEAIRKNIK